MSAKVDKTTMTALAVVMIVIAFVIFLLLFGSTVFNRTLQYEVTTLRDGWIITSKEGTVQVTSPGDVSFSDVLKGDTFTLETVLPEELLPGATITFYIPQVAMRIYAGDTLAYEYGYEAFATGRMLSRTMTRVTLPQGSGGKPLHFDLTVSENHAFSSFSEITYGNAQDLNTIFVEERRLPVMVGVFLCIYALFQLMWLPYLFVSGRRQMNIVFSALIMLVLGVYMLCNYEVLSLFGNLVRYSSAIEYICLYLLPLVFSAYLIQMFNGSARLVVTFCTVMNAAMFVSVIFLHIVNRAHITIFLPVFYLIALSESILLAIGIWRGVIKSDNTGKERLELLSDRTILAGFVIFILCSIADIIAYVLTASSGYGISFMLIGSIIFALCLTAEYFFHGVIHLRADVTREELTERAYTDPLTGLSNRIKCEQVMRDLGMNDRFIIISIDVDNLKQVNDAYGHAEGDRLLINFSLMLKDCFSDAELVGRMGGDEFLVILTGSQCAITDLKLKELERNMVRANLDERMFRYGASYGYAGHNETHFGNNVRDIYLLADRRMYDMKRGKKQGKEATGNA